MAKKQIVSPLPGTFYRRPTPDDPPFKSEGDLVTADDVVGLIEVMKSFYEVKAEVAGTLSKFLIENEDPVQAGQPLAEVDE